MNIKIHKWHTSPSHVALRADEVHIWRAPLEVPSDMVFRLRSSLSDDERARADRFYFEKDRVQFTVSHGILRDILGRYCGVAPAELRFNVGSHGKPEMQLTTPGERTNRTAAVERTQGATIGERVEFNMSHSRWMALYAVTLRRAVGVDIEYIREDFECERIAERFFHESETVHLRGLSEQGRSEAFFRFWTYKEAYIKGRGKGLSIPTRSFAVRVMDGGRAAIEHRGLCAANGVKPAEPTPIEPSGTDTGKTMCWSLYALDPAPGYAGAVAVEGDDALLVLWEW